MSPSKSSSVKWDSFSNIIDGQQRGAKSQHQGINPSTGESLWDVPIGTQQDVDEAVKSATKAFKSWKNVSMDERKKYLQQWNELLQAHNDEWTELLCKETGKPVGFYLDIARHGKNSI